MAGPICGGNGRSASPKDVMGNLCVAEIDEVGDDDADVEEDDDGDVMHMGDEVMRVQGEECRPVRKLGDPRKPNEDEVRQHELTHLPYELVFSLRACEGERPRPQKGGWEE